MCSYTEQTKMMLAGGTPTPGLTATASNRIFPPSRRKSQKGFLSGLFEAHWLELRCCRCRAVLGESMVRLFPREADLVRCIDCGKENRSDRQD